MTSETHQEPIHWAEYKIKDNKIIKPRHFTKILKSISLKGIPIIKNLIYKMLGQSLVVVRLIRYITDIESNL